MVREEHPPLPTGLFPLNIVVDIIIIIIIIIIISSPTKK